MKCQNPDCGTDLPARPTDEIEYGELDEVVAHQYNPEDNLAVVETAYYCDAQCFIEAHENYDA